MYLFSVFVSIDILAILLFSLRFPLRVSLRVSLSFVLPFSPSCITPWRASCAVPFHPACDTPLRLALLPACDTAHDTPVGHGIVNYKEDRECVEWGKSVGNGGCRSNKKRQARRVG